MFHRDAAIPALLEALASDGSGEAWREFLAGYSGLIYAVLKLLVPGEEEPGECFLYICDQLAKDKFRRLQKFDPKGRAQFSTWLRTVVRNLCIDWKRQQSGRVRMFAFVKERPAIDQQIFIAIFRNHENVDQALANLVNAGFNISYDELNQRIEHLRRSMTVRQLWSLTLGSRSASITEDSEEFSERVAALADPGPGPDTLAVDNEMMSAAARAIEDLDESDRLLLRLRFDEGLTLQEVAGLVGLKDAQTVDRRIREIISKLREKLKIYDVIGGKVRARSV